MGEEGSEKTCEYSTYMKFHGVIWSHIFLKNSVLNYLENLSVCQLPDHMVVILLISWDGFFDDHTVKTNLNETKNPFQWNS